MKRKLKVLSLLTVYSDGDVEEKTQHTKHTRIEPFHVLTTTKQGQRGVGRQIKKRKREWVTFILWACSLLILTSHQHHFRCENTGVLCVTRLGTTLNKADSCTRIQEAAAPLLQLPSQPPWASMPSSG